MTTSRVLWVAVALGALPLGGALAQNPNSGLTEVASLEDLLENVRNIRAAETAQREAWAAEFRAANATNQASMLRRAEQERTALEASSNALTETYTNNETRVIELNRQLIQKANMLGLGEVFGIARQAAGEVAVTLEQSLISTQFPPNSPGGDRVTFLREFSGSQSIPDAAELERVWLEMQREMTAAGQVARYAATVVQPGGEPVDGEVVRIGPFTATSNAQFLNYLPTLGIFSVLPRQLPPEFMEVAADFTETTSGYARAVVDGGRGVLLALYVERPTFGERIELGQEVGYVIIFVGLAGALFFLIQLVYLIKVRIAIAAQLKDLDRPQTTNPLGRVLLAFKGDSTQIEQDADVAELRISEAVLHEVPKLERFQAFLRLAVAAGPLLGLIGTVIGMILTFQSITESGTSDPKLMATGIGQAMIATVLGLGIAIPLLFANALLNSLSRTVVQILDEQSAGMLAESIERQRRA
ncbi:MAG TPA: MotA/TolQ/ExbB proton channel family protein [Gammaproteobacteria bacterium]|jgi:biopolymer transport protein ExbB